MIKYLEELKKLKLKKYVILGSGALAIKGIRENKDLDILVEKDTFLELKKKYKINEKGMIEIGHVEIWDNFEPWFDANLLIEDCEIIEGFRFMKLKYLIEWKKKFGREKDIRDLKLIEDYQKRLK
jgi:hypothetical protein